MDKESALQRADGGSKVEIQESYPSWCITDSRASEASLIASLRARASEQLPHVVWCTSPSLLADFEIIIPLRPEQTASPKIPPRETLNGYLFRSQVNSLVIDTLKRPTSSRPKADTGKLRFLSHMNTL